MLYLDFPLQEVAFCALSIARAVSYIGHAVVNFLVFHQSSSRTSSLWALLPPSGRMTARAQPRLQPAVSTHQEHPRSSIMAPMKQ